MVSVTMATSEWIQFFKEAGIPPGPAVNYAVMFVDNRIQKNMLMDLNKEIMNELGITVVGDIIAILKHAKIVYRQEMCKAATESLCPGSPNVQAELRRNANSAASRMIANSLSRDSPPTTPVRQRPHASKISVTVSNKLATAKAGTRTVGSSALAASLGVNPSGVGGVDAPEGRDPSRRTVTAWRGGAHANLMKAKRKVLRERVQRRSRQ
ncbi:hypothetical protein QYF61_008495 [Mycteria americana]|uniref:DUF5577 domain-containing protein n=1 Tax=Mycteria americana TaxID=33587 RepID=A0AAN7MIL0_MYCAM|nr:hypothetical protein QYF61_008495 [Mycteria americana]